MAWTRMDPNSSANAKEVVRFGVYVDDRSNKIYWQFRHTALE